MELIFWWHHVQIKQLQQCNCFFVELLSVYWRKAKLWVKFRYRLTAKGIALKNSQTNDK